MKGSILGWILLGFWGGAGVLYLYAKSGPEEAPLSNSAWEQVEMLRQDLASRKLQLTAEQSKEETMAPFTIFVQRLKDYAGAQPLGRYVFRIQPANRQLLGDSWIKKGVEGGFIDSQPQESSGKLQLVTFRKMEDLK